MRDKIEEKGRRFDHHTKLIIEKHRNGATGIVDLYFNENKTTFTELDASNTNYQAQKQSDDGEDEDFSF